MKTVWIRKIIQKRPNITTLLLCLAGIAANCLLSRIMSALNIPLYLDTFGTIAVALMGGYLPGVFVGFTTNIIRTIFEPSSLYYGILNVLVGFTAAFFGERGMHKKIGGIIGMVVTFTFIGGGIGSLIPWFMEGLSFDSESLSGMIYAAGFANPAVSHVISSIIMDFPDKLITVLLAVLTVRLIPERFYRHFRFGMWMQNPTEDEAVNKSRKTGVRLVSLRTKTLLVLVFSLAAVSVICTVLSVRVYRKMTVSEHSRLAIGTAELAAGLIDGDRVDDYLRNKGDSDDYRATKMQLEKILSNSSEIAYLYVYKMDRDGFKVVFDIDTEGAPAQEIGSLVTYDPGIVPYLHKLNSGEQVDPVMTNDRYGYLLTAATPVYNSDGRCVCYAIADVDMIKLRNDGIRFLTEMVSVFMGFFILLCTFVVWLADYHLIIPINSMARRMDRLAHSGDVLESMDDDVKAFRSLGIRTGDELENLYRAAASMTKNQAEQMHSIKRLSDSTAKMQDGLIITMADLVESRDSDTGAHVQKTAAYVRIIVEGLKKKGYYLQKLTPKFMSDVVRSAPLHDIGKINIPDGVLNKPGKLTDEEYEIMKTHTTAGKRIMENAISTVQGDNYLKEARNMAAYHHERWDGKGYPEGIHGEVIPLSARIMAVADVFDALTSPRVYKKAFTLEKSLEILEEGKGTQFDPKCVEVFMDSLTEVKMVLSKYNREM